MKEKIEKLFGSLIDKYSMSYVGEALEPDVYSVTDVNWKTSIFQSQIKA